MKRQVLFAVVVGAMALLLAGGAKADVVGGLSLTGCGSGSLGCPAANYTFDINNTTATLTITITGTPVSTNHYITGVNLGFTSSNKSISGLSLVSAPSSGWTSTVGSLSSGGTCGVNKGGFVCSSATPLNSLLITQGGVYTWVWSFDPLPSIFTNDIHIGAEYGPNHGNYKGLIVSQTATVVPEPTPIFLLGTGLLALGGFLFLRKGIA